MGPSLTFCLLLAGSMLSLTTAQSSCMNRVKTCQDVYEKDVYHHQYELTDYTDCLTPIDCSSDPAGKQYRMQLMDKIALAPVMDNNHYDTGSMFSLSLVLAFVCLLLSLRR